MANDPQVTEALQEAIARLAGPGIEAAMVQVIINCAQAHSARKTSPGFFWLVWWSIIGELVFLVGFYPVVQGRPSFF